MENISSCKKQVNNENENLTVEESALLELNETLRIKLTCFS